MKNLVYLSFLLFSHPSFATESKKKIIFDLANFKWISYYNNISVNSGIASGGKKYCPDIKRRCKTPIGIFKVISKKGKWYKSPLYPIGCSNIKGSKKLCASMSYAIKFKHSGESIHGGVKGKLTAHTSHGCIHVNNEDAYWLNQVFVDIDTMIQILKY